jgi:PAS domain S-box-containing protein
MKNGSLISSTSAETLYTALFNALPGSSYLLQANPPKYTILAATSQILKYSGLQRENLIGKGLFEAFPSNPEDPADTGQGNLQDSLKQVLEHKMPHQLPVQRYDVADEKGQFVERYWKAENLPVFDPEGEVSYIIHSTQDITQEVKSAEIKEHVRSLEESENDLRSLVKQIEESEERLSNIVNQVNAGIAQTTTQGQFINVNERFCQLTGYTKEELRERTIKSITYPDDWPHNEELVVKALSEGKNFFIEKRYLRKDGSVVWVNNSVSVVTDRKGKKFITAVSIDITEQITNRQKLEESEDRFRSMADASPVMIWTLDAEGNSTYYNSRAAEFTGHTEGELREGKSWQVAIHPDDMEFAGGVVRNAVIKRIPYQMECRMQRADGEWRWLLNHGTPRFGKAGNYFGFVGSSIDITEHKKSQLELQTALEQVRLSKEAAELGTFDLNLEKGTMHWDERCRTLFGISHQDPVTYEKDFAGGLHPEDRERILEVIDNVFIKSISNGDYDVEYRTVGAEDGVIRWIRAKGKVYFDKEEKPVRFIGSVLDITDLVTSIHKIEEEVEERTRELEAQKSLLNNILTNSSNGITVTEMIRDESGNVIDARTILANDAAVNYIGLPKEIFLSKTAIELDPNILSSSYGQTCLNTLRTGEPALSQYYMELTGRWQELTISKMDDEHLIHIFTDVTPIKEAQLKLERTIGELRRSNRNLEEFAHAASHDLKEPIRKIHFFTSQLKAQLSNRLAEGEERSFSRIENATQRMGNLIDDLLLYSHVSQRPIDMENVDLNEKVQRVLDDLELDVQQKGAIISVDKLPVVQGYRRQLQQLFQNLISNALKYSKKDVPPRINISATEVTEHEKSYHLITVKDNGIGFEQEYADKIFQMFTRLHGKGEYSGTGVGLSIVKKVVENHNGFIKVESTLGVGSTFNVLLPA